jgi:hypothetical protein
MRTSRPRSRAPIRSTTNCTPAGCAAVLEEHASGADRSRPVLARLLREIRPGETLVPARPPGPLGQPPARRHRAARGERRPFPQPARSDRHHHTAGLAADRAATAAGPALGRFRAGPEPRQREPLDGGAATPHRPTAGRGGTGRGKAAGARAAAAQRDRIASCIRSPPNSRPCGNACRAAARGGTPPRSSTCWLVRNVLVWLEPRRHRSDKCARHEAPSAAGKSMPALNRDDGFPDDPDLGARPGRVTPVPD